MNDGVERFLKLLDHIIVGLLSGGMLALIAVLAMSDREVPRELWLAFGASLTAYGVLKGVNGVAINIHQRVNGKK
ncbi:MAG TPA: hypothetical protein VMY35_08225 [Phycisphaerae bacterium]|nr:hypothetical protein [Phycisphaerae bacterium]